MPISTVDSCNAIPQQQSHKTQTSMPKKGCRSLGMKPRWCSKAGESCETEIRPPELQSTFSSSTQEVERGPVKFLAHLWGEQVTNVVFSASYTVSKVFLRLLKFIYCNSCQLLHQDNCKEIWVHELPQEEAKKHKKGNHTSSWLKWHNLNCRTPPLSYCQPGCNPFSSLPFSFFLHLISSSPSPQHFLFSIYICIFIYIYIIRGIVTWLRTDLI